MGSGFKGGVAGYVRAWEGKELSEIYQSFSKINSKKKEGDITSD